MSQTEPAISPADPGGPCYGCTYDRVAAKVTEATILALEAHELESTASVRAIEAATMAYLRALAPDWGRLCGDCEEEYRAGGD